MVLSILVAIIAAPALLASQESIRQSQGKEKREEHRARRCNLIATCVKSSMRSRELNGRPIVLRDGKLYIDTGTNDGSPYGPQYAGYYLPYPDTDYEGLVTTITDEAPVMNWVFVDKDTCEVKYGVRAEAQHNLTGPFDCTRQDRRLIFLGWEGWCAVEEFPNVWALYFDKDDDGLRAKLPPGTRVLEVELTRKEKGYKSDASQRLQDQATQRAVDVKAEAPTDTPIEKPALQQPGVRTAPLEPLKIPTSTFVQESQAEAPLPPKTPPPAYTPNLQPESLPTMTPPTTISAKLQSTPPSEKRTTPRLNRSSGTRALEQAKRFERLSQMENENALRSNESLAFRPTSDMNIADIAASYVELLSPAIDDLEPDQCSERLDASTLVPRTPLINPISVLQEERSRSTRTLVSSGRDRAIVSQKSEPITVVLPASDPAVFGGYDGAIDEDEIQRFKSPANDSLAIETLLQRKNSIRRAPDSQAPRAPLPPLPTAIGPRRPGQSNPGAYITEKSSSERSRISVGAAKEASRSAAKIQSKRSSPSSPRSKEKPAASLREKVSRPSPRALSRAVTTNSATTISRLRNGSISPQKKDFSRPSLKTSPRTTNVQANKPQSSMNTTMTTGTKNQGMSSRLGPQLAVQRRGRSKTTSALFREIDDILELDGSRNETTTSTSSASAQAPTTRARRSPFLKKVETRIPAKLRPNGSSPRRDGFDAKPTAERRFR